MTYAPTTAIPTAPSTEPERRRGIPSLDGFRALAVLCVIWWHGSSTLPAGPLLNDARTFLPSGYFGVQTFFVISGFLITTLLVKEREKRGRISIPGFYARRAFRILPALWVFLIVLLVLSLGFRMFHTSVQDFLSTVFFVRDYYMSNGAWWLGHTWSLSVEEQFYLLWPLLIVLLSRKMAIRLLTVGVILSPVVRLATYVLPHGDLRVALMFHTRADTLMIGCLMALLVGNQRFERAVEWAIRHRFGWLAVAWLPLSWYMASRFAGVWLYTVGYIGDSVAIAALMMWMIHRPQSPFGRFLNWRPIVYIGMISYSLYLWQQMFVTPANQTILGGFAPFGLAITFACAMLSYHLVEQPFLRLRSRVMRGKAAARTEQTAEVLPVVAGS